MRLLLLNNNPAVSRLIKLSADKAGHELDEFDDFGLIPLSHYDVILVDNEMFEEEAVEGVKETTECEYVVYIGQRGAQKPESANVMLEKPFLPTDFLTLLDKVHTVLESLQEEQSVPSDTAEDNDEPMKGFDIDNIDNIDIDKNDDLELNLASSLDEDEEEKELSFDDLELDDHVTLEGQDPIADEEKDESFDTLDFNEELDQLDDEDEKEASKELAPEESFDFEDEHTLEESAPVIEEEAHNNPCVLDKDDINEVKQLLDDDEEAEEKSDVDLALESLKEEDNEFFFDDPMDKVEEEVPEEASSSLLDDEDLFQENEQETADESKEDDFDLSLKDDDTDLMPLEEDKEEDEVSLEEHEPLVFAENEETLIPQVDEAIETIEHEEEESIVPHVDVAMHEMKPVLSVIESLDDLNENLLKSAFGEEVDEADEAMLDSGGIEEAPLPKTTDIEVIRGEIEDTISHSISTLAKSDILKEALKGMRINIAITFDEK